MVQQLTSPVDINDPSSFNHCNATVNQNQYHYVDQGPRSAPLIVLVHGFPESWYCWKHQIKHLSETLLFRVVAIDKPGYGETRVGKDLVNYTLKSTCKDLYTLVKEVIGRDRAIYIGHDWGSMVIWMMGLYHPEAVISLASLSLPFFPATNPYVPLREMAKKYPFLNYQVALAEGDVTEFNQNIKEFLECFWSASNEPIEKSVLFTPIGTSIIDYVRETKPEKINFPSKNMINYLTSQFSIQGCEGPTNWYRTKGLNHIDSSEFPPDVKITHPSLLIMEAQGLFSSIKGHSYDNFVDLTIKKVDGGHWLQISNYEEVNQLITEWLTRKELLPMSN